MVNNRDCFCYRIGLDIGIASVGYAVLEHDANDEPRRIIKLGVVTFEPAEKPKDGSSLAVERRVARGTRRLLRRRRYRVESVKELLLNSLLKEESEKITNNEIDNYIEKEFGNLSKELKNDKDYFINLLVFKSLYKNFDDLVECRALALDKRITNQQLSKLLLYFVKHRGFKSNRKCEEASGETGKVLKAISQNEEFFAKNNYRTLGEAFYKDEKYRLYSDENKVKYTIRNKKNNYTNCFRREQLEQEIKLILQKQQELGNSIVSDEFINSYLSIFNKQRSFDDGPNDPSPYKANFAVGNCTFEKNEKRAPKASYSYEAFALMQKLNNLKLINEQKESTELSILDKQLLFNKLILKDKITYEDIRKLLKLNDEIRFNISYDFNKETKLLDVASSEKKAFIKLGGIKKITKALGLKNAHDYKEIINETALILCLNKSDENRRLAFKNSEITCNLKEEQIEKLLELNFSKFGNLSVKALDNIFPYMFEGKKYYEACELAGYNFNDVSSNEKQYKININNLKAEFEQITSPVAKRAIGQSIKVVNAIIDCYGSPCAIFIEVSKDMSKNQEDRKIIAKQQEQNADKNEKIVEILKGFGITAPNGQDIVKYKLYLEQDGKCAYSQNSFEKVLGSPANIFNNNTQIDHIIPFSKCYDDSYSNKVLVLSSENQNKGDNLPYEAFGNNPKKWQSIQNFALSVIKNPKKQENLLKKSLSDEQISELNNRALNDTRHACVFIQNLFNNYLLFAPSKLSKKPVRTVNGFMTSYLRKVWGLNKVRFENDKHHALDACVVACCTNTMIKNVSKYLQNTSRKIKSGELVIDWNKKQVITQPDGEIFTFENYMKSFGPLFLEPYFSFVKELKIRMQNSILEHDIKELIGCGYIEEELQYIKPIFVSRMPTRKVKGAIHDSTLRSATKDGRNNFYITKKSVVSLKLDKNNEIEGYPDYIKKSDPQTYNVLRNRLIEFNGDAKKAFAQPVYKPSKNENIKNEIKSVKIEEKHGNVVNLNKTGGYADNGSMIRIDIFTKNNENYIVPVYVSDAYAKVLPNKAIASGKDKENWIEMDDSYTFLFSLYRNDLIKIKRNENIKAIKNIGSKTQLIEINDCFLYYRSTDISSGTISAFSHDREISARGIGIRKTITFEKYLIDILGNISKVKKEKRMPISFN